MGDFDHGMQVGAELSYLGMSIDESDDTLEATAVGGGTSMGAFIGYKFAADFGLTVSMDLLLDRRFHTISRRVIAQLLSACKPRAL